MNQPMRMYHRPPSESPLSRLKTPVKMRRKAKKVPAPLAIRVARALPIAPQRAPRSSRPPSIGKAGTRLNSARIRLIRARYFSTAATDGLTNDRVEPAWKTPARARLTRGPAAAIQNSALPLLGSCSSCATPPKMNRVIDRVRTPCRRATTACPSS